MLWYDAMWNLQISAFHLTMFGYNIFDICCSYYFNSSSELDERFLHKLKWGLSKLCLLCSDQKLCVSQWIKTGDLVMKETERLEKAGNEEKAKS